LKKFSGIKLENRLSNLLPAPTRRQILQAASALLIPGALPAATDSNERPPAVRLTDGWEFHGGAIGGIWEIWRGAVATSNVNWAPVTLPHCFNAYDAVDPDREYYEGPGWYRKTVPVENPYPGGRTLLHFEGAGQRSEVFVGLERVGQHLGGYDEFTVDITDTGRRAGNADIAVLCDNSRDLETIPSDLSDFTRYGGLYRHVNLLYVPAVSTERLHVETKVTGGEASIELRARLWNPAQLKDPVNLKARILDASGKAVGESEVTLAPWTGDRKIAEFKVAAPALWSPAAPNLYRCLVTLDTPHGAQQLEERFGLRFFDFPEHGVFLLNGRKLFLRGTQRHEDHAGLGAAMTDDLLRQEMRLVKDMGANFIRLGHYQQSRRVLDLCDELGLLVWEEIPWCRGGVGGAQYKEQAQRMLRNMIDQHRNHPAIVFWGLGNENDWPGDFPTFDRQGIRDLFTTLHRIAHEADPSRLTAIRRCAFAADIPDVYSPSIWAGWYSGRYTEYKQSVAKEAKQIKRMLHIEWGGDSHAGRHAEDPDRVIARIATGQGVEEKERAFLLTGGQERASKDGDWSESYICNLLDWHLKEQETMDWLAGAAHWVFKDFATPLRPENPVPRVNQKGVLERDLTPKEGFYVFQSYWSDRPMARIYGHSWPVRWGDAGERKVVKVYSNCLTAELFLNGISCGARQRNSQDFPAAGLRWQTRFEPGENRLRVVARKGAVEVSDEIRFHYQTAKWGKPDHLTLGEIGRTVDRVTLEARIFDASGVPCLDARNVVRFSLAGDGELIQNLGTAGGSRKVELANGRATIGVRLARGAVAVSVSTDGLPTAIRTIGI
jgi:beta-galactosidase